MLGIASRVTANVKDQNNIIQITYKKYLHLELACPIVKEILYWYKFIS